ncbi:MAG: bifunctional tetrahydrofolate synthase/dihydrofolate synthase [Rhodocyclaceae bacterium]|nr:bifunctional tetrahydrofolate synthase/dihydrofolate synthase [Rhodocyclaceae bacterium]
MPQNLAEWLAYIERAHAETIALGLDRVACVAQRMAFAVPPVVITVGGTNGKGSTCAMLESILLQAGYRVGLYTSPHILAYNERVRINGQALSDEALCAGFAAVDAARGEVALTYFEFGTLAAMHAFAQAGLDAVILEVGLGGRLDAVNIFDADCAIVTSVDLDHMEWLGHTREAIGFEKAGIFRAGRPAVVGDPMPPDSLVEHARAIGAQLHVSGRDFGFAGDRQQWGYWRRAERGLVRRGGLAYPALRGANQLLNASAAITALEVLRDKLPVGVGDIRRGLILVDLPARFQVLPGRPAVVLDVAHNPHAAAVLAENLSNMGFFPETWAVVGMLRDKDMAGTLRGLARRIDRWLLADLPGPRGASALELRDALDCTAHAAGEKCFERPAEAFLHARAQAQEGDRIVVFGSFLTVADVMPVLRA